MLLSVFRRWRAGRFADLLDRPPDNAAPARRGPRHRALSRSDQKLSALAALARQTAEAQRELNAELDPDLRAALRAELVAAVEHRADGPANDATPPSRVTRP